MTIAALRSKLWSYKEGTRQRIRIQVNSTSFGLAIDIDNPLAFLFGEFILVCSQHN